MQIKKEPNKFVITKDDAIKALYRDDLDRFLKKANILDDFYAGALKCTYCGQTVSLDNLFAFIPTNKIFALCCTSPECTKKMMQGATK